MQEKYSRICSKTKARHSQSAELCEIKAKKIPARFRYTTESGRDSSFYTTIIAPFTAPEPAPYRYASLCLFCSRCPPFPPAPHDKDLSRRGKPVSQWQTALSHDYKKAAAPPYCAHTPDSLKWHRHRIYPLCPMAAAPFHPCSTCQLAPRSKARKSPVVTAFCLGILTPKCQNNSRDGRRIICNPISV